MEHADATSLLNVGASPQNRTATLSSRRVGSQEICASPVRLSGAALGARALVPGGLARRDVEQRPGDESDLPAMMVGLGVAGAAGLSDDRGLHFSSPCLRLPLRKRRPQRTIAAKK